MLCKGYGGAERAFVDTCLSLAEAGVEVLAVIDHQFYARHQLQHPRLIVAPIRILTRFDPLAKWQIARVLRQFGANLAHIHLRRSMIVAAKTCQQQHIPVLATIHNYSKLTAYHSADWVIALTQEHAHYLTQHHAGFAGKITVVPNFSRFSTTEAVIPPTGPLKFLAYGRFVPKKGFDVAIAAFAQARRQMPEARLTIVGAGAEAAALRQQIHTLGLAPVVELNGWSDAVSDLLDQYDVLVLPSRHEAFGIVALEAMARGKAIVSTRCEGPRQFLSESACFFCQPGDAADLAAQLVQVYQQRQQAQQRAIVANQLFRQHYAAAVVIPQLQAVYQQVITSNTCHKTHSLGE